MNALVYKKDKLVELSSNFLDEFKLAYSVCYYAERCKHENLVRHLLLLNSLTIDQIESRKVLFIIVCAFDEEDENYIKEKITSLWKELDENKLYLSEDQLIFLPIKNWGGTVAALWHCWSDIIKKFNINVEYIAHFEEDFYPVNFLWFRDAARKLTEDIVYVGEISDSNIEFKITNKRGQVLKDSKERIKLFETEAWTDGGFYFSTPEKLLLIEQKIGIFHKGNVNQKWDHHVDGVDYGEVGFPTLLYHSRLSFTSIFRGDYFVHEIIPSQILSASNQFQFKKMSLEDLNFFLSIRNEISHFLDDEKKYNIRDCITWFFSSKPEFYIIVYDEQKIGYVRTSNRSIEEKSIYLGMDLHKNFRGKSLSFKSYNDFFIILKSQGISTVYLNVLEFNKRAYALYKKLEFKETEKFSFIERKRSSNITAKLKRINMRKLL